MIYEITSHIDINIISKIIQDNRKIALSTEAKKKITASRSYLDNVISKGDEPIYGVNTGFGSLCNTLISKDELEQLQTNLLMSHACGVGEEVPEEIVKLMLLLKIQSLALGYSGVQLEVVERLIEFYNNNISPVIYQQGSLGASGDLAPLAHLSLPLIGRGEEVRTNNSLLSADKVIDSLGWKPIKLKAKDGLSLLNGTQFMSAYGMHCLLEIQKLLNWSDAIAALSVDAFDCRVEPFLPHLHNIRPHEGQKVSAKKIIDLLEGSELINAKKIQVQDPYSFRCIPQVHGATRDAIEYVNKVFHTEINSVTDNPTVFAEDNKIISGGNFHGQPLAIAFDLMCIAIAELGSISERRIFQLISGTRGLPAFLTSNPGINSGLMITQYTAASIASQNKQLATPASVDSIVSSNGQEDHVSMGANAAVKALAVVKNTQRILAIELLVAAQALDFRRPLKSSPVLERLHAKYREHVSFAKEDRILFEDIQNSVKFINSEPLIP